MLTEEQKKGIENIRKSLDDMGVDPDYLLGFLDDQLPAAREILRVERDLMGLGEVAVKEARISTAQLLYFILKY